MFSGVQLENVRGINRKIVFEPGVTCLIGPNGSGKSTTIESICFATFGSGMLRGSVAELLDKESSISVWGNFPISYAINRTQKVCAMKFDNGEMLTKTKDVAKYFAELFGTKEVFLTVFVANQGAVAEIASVRASVRRKLLVELLGLAVLDDAVKELGRACVGVFKPTMTVEEVKTQLEAADAIAKDADLQQLATAIQIKKELAHLETLPGDPAKARQGLELVNDTLMKAKTRLGEINRVVSLKSAIRNEVLSDGATQCPICYSDIASNIIATQLDKDLATLGAQITEAQQEIDKLGAYRNRFAPAASAKTRGEILNGNETLLERFPNPEDAHNAALQRSGLHQQLTAVQQQWEEYEKKVPIKELTEHLRAFLSHILVKYFNRLKLVVGSYLSTYTRFKDFTLTEDFDMMVDGRGVWTLSGGERDLVCTILRVALSQVVSEARFGCCPIIIFDSAFDSISDNELAQIVELLRESPFERVIITHHNAKLATQLEMNYVNLGEV